MYSKLFKIVFPFLFFLITLNNINAINIDEILKKSKEISSAYNDMINDSKNYDYNAVLLNYDEDINYKFGLNSYIEEEKDNSYIFLSPFVSYLNDNDNSSEISFKIPMNIVYRSDVDLSNSYSPTLSYNQKILLDGIRNKLKTYSKQKAVLQSENYKKRIELEFENNVLSSIISILKKQGEYLVLKSNYNILEKEFDALVDNSFIKDGTYSYNVKNSALLEAKNNTDNAKQILDNELREFERLCGFGYEDLDDLKPIELEFDEKTEFNYKVYDAYLDKLIAENEYDMLSKNNNKVMNLSFDADMNIKDENIDKYNISLLAGYKDDLFQAEIFSDIKIDKILNKTYPKVGLNFAFNIGSNKNITDKINIEKSFINYQNKSFEYDNAIFDYKNDVKDVKDRISLANVNKDKEKKAFENAQIEYDKDIELYNNGYYSDIEFDLKKSEFVKAKNDYNAFILQLMILERDSKILNF